MSEAPEHRDQSEARLRSLRHSQMRRAALVRGRGARPRGSFKLSPAQRSLDIGKVRNRLFEREHRQLAVLGAKLGEIVADAEPAGDPFEDVVRNRPPMWLNISVQVIVR